MGESLAGRHLHANAGVLAVARVPPIVPHARFDGGGLARTEDSCLPGELHGQLTLEHGQTLNESGMAVLAHDPRPNQRCQLGSHAAVRIVVRKFEDRGPLARHRVLPDLTNMDRGAVWRAVRIGVRHTGFLNATVSLSSTCTLGVSYCDFSRRKSTKCRLRVLAV